MKRDWEATALLTDEERRAYIQKALGHRLQKPGKLFLPTTQVYDTLATDSGIQHLFIELCRWLGVKPGSTHVSYRDILGDFIVDGQTIYVAKQYQGHPFIAGSVLSLTAIAFALSRHNTALPDRAFLELSTIETGLGLFVLNGLPPKLSFFQNTYHIVANDWYHREGFSLLGYQKSHYAHLLAEWAHANRVPAEEYLPHVRNTSRNLLPQYVARLNSPNLPSPKVMHARNRASRLFWLKLLLLGGILAVIIAGTLFVWAQRKPAISASQLEAEQSLQIMKRSYDACVLKATGQRNTYDPNDLLLERQVEATQSKCESLRNEYNHALDQYQLLYIR